MMSSKYKLMAGIDINNKELVTSLISYIKTVTNDTMLKKVFNHSEDCKRFIFDYIGIDHTSPDFKIDDISFLHNGEKIIGYLIARIKKETAKLTIQEYEYSIPEGFDLEELKQEYLNSRVNSDYMRSDIYEESYQK